jgi:hypothetical protein
VLALLRVRTFTCTAGILSIAVAVTLGPGCSLGGLDLGLDFRVHCSVAADCKVTSIFAPHYDGCNLPVCTAGLCKATSAPEGIAAQQTDADCDTLYCDGKGGVIHKGDPSDTPVESCGECCHWACWHCFISLNGHPLCPQRVASWDQTLCAKRKWCIAGNCVPIQVDAGQADAPPDDVGDDSGDDGGDSSTVDATAE